MAHGPLFEGGPLIEGGPLQEQNSIGGSSLNKHAYIYTGGGVPMHFLVRCVRDSCKGPWALTQRPLELET